LEAAPSLGLIPSKALMPICFLWTWGVPLSTQYPVPGFLIWLEFRKSTLVSRAYYSNQNAGWTLICRVVLFDHCFNPPDSHSCSGLSPDTGYNHEVWN
jgi:hypothetical protein